MAIFLSAFLLFQVQPLIGKAILPWFGGTPAVWMTCMLFFQVALLLGYVYAHWLSARLGPRAQGLTHIALLAVTLALLPLAPSAAWKPETAADPTWRILALLTVTVGLPFLVLASTGPLLQAWFARHHPGRSPYRLYALSNAGSLLGLLTYPFLVEPNLRLADQMRLWSVGHAVFVALCIGWAVRTARAKAATEAAPAASAASEPSQPSAAPGRRPDVLTVGLWLALSACASAMLLATTNQISQNVAPVPFLWILPLSLYLLTFILCFDSDRWYRRDVAAWLVAVAFLGTSIVLLLGPQVHLGLQLAVAAFTLFACCMACHGELVGMRPGTRHLTAFYLSIAGGGALGGMAVAIVAPRLFDSLMEYPAALAACCVAMLLARRRATLGPVLERRLASHPFRLATLSAVVVVVGTAGTAGASHAWNGFLLQQDVLVSTRNFFGMLQVGQRESDDPERHVLTLKHGTTLHGVQYQAPGLRRRATAYYGKDSGLDHTLRRARTAHPEGLSIAVVGMGVGTAAAYAEAGDRMTFYEIDPEVDAFAREYFSFWGDAVARGATLDVRIGDGRLVLERELAAGVPGDYDVLVVDAFSSDAIPMHLLTEECFEVYLAHLADGGMLAVHVSNHYLDVAVVVRAQAARHALAAENLRDLGDMDNNVFPNEWVLVARPGGSVDAEAAAASWPAGRPSPAPWTDDYSSLLPLLK
ncbi:MAG: spermidine synthase [Planctomycetota bacterium]